MNATRHEITGTVRLKYDADEAAKGKKVCIDCPDFPGHVFSMYLELPPYPTSHPEHFGRDLKLWIDSVFRFKSLEGRRIRVTAELVPEGADVPVDRWNALRDYLSEHIAADEAVRQGMVADGETELAAPFGGLVSANRSTLAKMRELEQS
jgi:hypothetical protein